MNAHALIEEARADGLELLPKGGILKLIGASNVVERWKPRIVASKPEIMAALTAPRLTWWLIHYHERDPVKVVCFPEATHTEILERHPDATAAEPFIPIIRQATTPLSAEAESAIRAWLALIEETDLAIIAEVIRQCQQDADARHYFNGRAAFSV